MFDPIKGSIWKSNINFFLGALLLGSCGLWAIIVIVETAWNVNPVATAFAEVVYKETGVKN